MSNNDNLLEQLIIYEDLTKERELLNKELSSLSGKNDTDSINRINEIGRLLNENNSKISSYDKDKLAKVEKYFSSEREFRRLSNEIKAFENLSKKGEEELVEVRSAEGRPKKIYKSLAEEYQKLTEQKSSMRSSFLKEYNDIKNYPTMIIKTKEEISAEPTGGTDEVLVKKRQDKMLTENSEISVPKDYNKLTEDEKKNYLKNRIQNIIASGKLPNTGKKSQVMYEGTRYNIPTANRGKFYDATSRLNALNKRVSGKGIGEAPSETVQEVVSVVKNEIPREPLKETPKERFEKTLYDVYGQKNSPLSSVGVKETQKETFDRVAKEYSKDILPILPNKIENTKKPITLPDIMDYCKKNNIDLHPTPKVTFRDKNKINLAKTTTTKKKISLSDFKKMLPKAYNIDKRIELAYTSMQEKLSKKGIKIKEDYIRFSNNVKNRYTTSKSYVASIPRKVKDYVKNKYAGLKKYLRDKREISRLRKKEGYTKKEAMEEVYGKEKNKHLDYRIVNRVTKFKENTCQKIETTKGKITDTTKKVVNTITKPFKWLREDYHDDVGRTKLQEQINANREKTDANRKQINNSKVKTLKLESSGYVGTIVITVMGVLVLAGIIFIGVGNLINR